MKTFLRENLSSVLDFMTQVFFFLSTTTIIHGVNVSLKVTKIIKKLLEKSKNAKLLESISNYRDAF